MLIKTKVTAGLAAAAVAIIAIGSVFVIKSIKVGAMARETTGQTYPTIAAVNELAISLRDIEHGFTKAIHYADEPALQTGNTVAAAFRQQVTALQTLTEDVAVDELSATFGVYLDTVNTVVNAILNGDDFDETKIGAIERLATDLRERLSAFRQTQVDRFTGHLASTIAISEEFTRLTIASVIAGMLGIATFALLVIRALRPLNPMVNTARRIALGDIHQVISHRSNDEVGALADAFRESIDYIQGIAGLADALSQGNFTSEVTPRSDNDALSQSFARLQNNLHGMVDETGELVAAARDGELDRRGDPERFHGGYRDLVQGLNQTLDAIIAPLHEATEVLERLAARDLTRHMVGEYPGDYGRISAAVNRAVDNTAGALETLHRASDDVLRSSQEIAAGNQDLASRTEVQATSLEEVAEAMGRMTTAAQLSAEGADRAKTLAGEAQLVADRGGTVVGEAVAAMAAIDESSDRIAAIIDVIDEIAFQTNLLSLNAAVEAARAGEHGRGFAVVAAEVRNLARRSAKAAQEIKGLIHDSVARVNTGTKLVNSSGETLGEILQSISEVRTLVAEIAGNSQEQATGIESVNLALRQVHEGNQHNTALVEQVAATAAVMSERAREMQGQVLQFNAG
ncbi:MAG: methyl-accepting chemotaxis protein [Nitrospirota bacterium]|jgi:methyl-accepting chemotaxis protein